MSSKIGLFLSSIFVVLFFAFGIDLISIQFTYSDLDAKSTAISYQISKHGGLDDAFISNIENKYSVDFTCLDNCYPLFGDVVNYSISKTTNTMVISKQPLNVTIKRSAVIGYFG